MFRTKICGITNWPDAKAAVDAGADALGFNFYRRSKRFVEHEPTWHITTKLPADVISVGVFVNHAVNDIEETIEHLRLDCVQLHGEEPPTFLAELPKSVKIVRAFRCGAEGLAPLAEYLSECRAVGRMPDAVLIDADAGDDYGGSGAPADWARVAKDRRLIGNLSVILAGGLTPENVAAAITAVRPDGVDVASGVESSPGCKDANLVRRFVAEAQTALTQISVSQ
jgi:phosphoribosylanthranilate isomerase